MNRNDKSLISVWVSKEEHELLKRMLDEVPVSVWFRRKMRQDLEIYLLSQEDNRFIPDDR